MRYCEIQPGPALVPFVECFWTLEDETASCPTAPDPLLPDGCVELILNFGERFSEHRHDGTREVQPLNILVGQMTHPVVIAPTGAVRLVGVRFHPGGTYPFLHLPMRELTNRVVDLGALGLRLEKSLMEKAEDAPSLRSKVNAIENLLNDLLQQHRKHSKISHLAAAVVRSGGHLSVETLCNNAGISSRQLERRFQIEVGIGPKLLCRILRFQQVFRIVNSDDTSWADVAYDCGYYDQAHLIRDFQEFAHQTPAALFENTSALTESFTRKNRVSDFSNTPN